MRVPSFKELKSQITIEQILSAYGLDRRLTLRNSHLYGPCPLHGGDNQTAFRVNIAKGIWHCFTHCGGGDIIDLIQTIEQCSYAEVAHHLNKLLVPSRNVFNIRTTNHLPPHDFVPFRRKIALNPIIPFLQETKRISPETATHFEAGLPLASTFLKGTVAVRLFDWDGSPLGYCGRNIDRNTIKDWGKWRFPHNFPKKETMYNAHRAQHAAQKAIVVVECPWAVMRLTQAGIPAAVALLGTSLSKPQQEWLRKFNIIILMLDGDQAGRAASKKIQHSLLNYADCRVVTLPEGSEPEDLDDSELHLMTQSASYSFLNP